MRLERFEFSQLRMGVDTPIVVYAPRESQAVEACRAAYTRISQLEQQMSDYRLDSELNAVCKEAVEEALPRALQMRQPVLLDVAIDPTVPSLF